MAPITLLEKECGPKCRSRNHVEEVISLIVCGTLQEFQAYSTLCHNWSKNSDHFGRTALHVAASCGKFEILQWLLEDKKVDVSTKDMESGYTALHRALFYGQIACAKLLITHKADLQPRDTEGFTALDIAMLDRPPNVSYTIAEPNEIYTWGDNANNTIGHSGSQKRNVPEVIDVFRRSSSFIKQVMLCKYHSVFLSHGGHVYTCGHGQGGRLGHGDHNTVLVPKVLEILKGETCLEIATATDHTLLRMEGGAVYAFGINTHHQLGLTPYVDASPTPKQMNLKALKGRRVVGVSVGRFHSVVWTSNSVFSVGLNAGQLGHQKGEHHCGQLRQVSFLRHTDIGISRIACSDAATVCLTTRGDVYVLHEYQCRKVASKWACIEQVLVVGGNLDHTAGLERLIEKGGLELQIFLRTQPGQLFLWRNNSPTLKRCHWSMKRQLWVSDAMATQNSLIVATKTGEAFMAFVSNKKTGASSKEAVVKDGGKEENFVRPRLLDQMLKEETEDLQARRLPAIHRAVLVASDRKGRNFAVIQTLPSGCLSELPSVTTVSLMTEQFSRLLADSCLGDNIHDAIIQVGNREWPVHKYIIGMRSDHFLNSVLAKRSNQDDPLTLKVDRIHPEIMEQVVQFMYTDTCDFLKPGYKVNINLKEDQSSGNIVADHGMNGMEEFIPPKGVSAFQMRQIQNQNRSTKMESPKSKGGEEETDNSKPLKALRDVARRFGVKGLAQRLESVKCKENVIVATSKTTDFSKPTIKFDRKKLPELYDVTISTQDGKEMRCHKCVLVCRLEYFYSMLATGWVESQTSVTLTLPVSFDVGEVLIDFLYSDEAPTIRDSTNEEFLCNLLVVADQLLAWRLKEMCEVALANIITLRNVSELLEFSCVYNADQLKLSCQQFVSLNITAILEGRLLENVSDETLQELTQYYRNMIPNMPYRVMSIPDVRPNQQYVDELVAKCKGQEWSVIEAAQSQEANSKKGRGQQTQKKKGKARKQSASEDEVKTASIVVPTLNRNLSVNSDASAKSEEDFVAIAEEISKQFERDMKKSAATSQKSGQKGQAMPNGQAVVQADSDLKTVGVPTQPEDVPVWTPGFKTLTWSAASNKNANNAISINSSSSSNSHMKMTDLDNQSESHTSVVATSPTSPTSLRDIMNSEAQGTSEVRKSGSSGRISWKEIKKQQVRENKEKQQRRTSSDSADTVPATSPPKVSANPWASISNTVNNTVKSFRDLMLQDKDSPSSSPVTMPQRRSHSNSSGASVVAKSPQGTLISWGLAGRSQSISVASSPPTQAATPGNPWQRRADQMAASPPLPSPVASAINFSDIVQDEMEKSKTLVQVSKKPLSLIQLEETAMLELLKYYRADSRVDEYVTVERVGKVMADPLWRRERKPSGQQ